MSAREEFPIDREQVRYTIDPAVWHEMCDKIDRLEAAGTPRAYLENHARLRGELDRLTRARIELESKMRRREADVSSLVAQIAAMRRQIECDDSSHSGDLERFKAHSVIANAAAWKLAGMLGLRPEGDPGPVEMPSLLELVDLLERQTSQAQSGIGRAMGHLRHAALALPTVETHPKAERVSDGPATIREGA